VFATNPSKGVASAEYQQVYATESRTPSQAIAKVRPLAEGRRLRALLSTGKYRDELLEARWGFSEAGGDIANLEIESRLFVSCICFLGSIGFCWV